MESLDLSIGYYQIHLLIIMFPISLNPPLPDIAIRYLIVNLHCWLYCEYIPINSAIKLSKLKSHAKHGLYKLPTGGDVQWHTLVVQWYAGRVRWDSVVVQCEGTMVQCKGAMVQCKGTMVQCKGTMGQSKGTSYNTWWDGEVQSYKHFYVIHFISYKNILQLVWNLQINYIKKMTRLEIRNYKHICMFFLETQL